MQPHDGLHEKPLSLVLVYSCVCGGGPGGSLDMGLQGSQVVFNSGSPSINGPFTGCLGDLNLVGSKYKNAEYIPKTIITIPGIGATYIDPPMYLY